MSSAEEKEGKTDFECKLLYQNGPPFEIFYHFPVSLAEIRSHFQLICRAINYMALATLLTLASRRDAGRHGDDAVNQVEGG